MNGASTRGITSDVFVGLLLRLRCKCRAGDARPAKRSAEQAQEAPQPKRSTGFIIPKKAPPVEQPDVPQLMLHPEAGMSHTPQPMAMRYPQQLPAAPQAPPPWYAPVPAAAPLAHPVAYEPYVPQMPSFVAPPQPPPPPAVAFRTGAFDPRRVRARRVHELHVLRDDG
jgi:hypothetical protein